MGLPLVMVGTGSMEKRLKQTAKSNIKFVGFVSDDELKNYYQNCKALIYFHEEDFGIAPVEAMSVGKPVVGLNTGGVAETVIDGQTGVLGNNLEKLIPRFLKMSFNHDLIIKHAQQFSKDRFSAEFLLELTKT